jgi:hypothetical protein
MIDNKKKGAAREVQVDDVEAFMATGDREMLNATTSR